MSTHVNNQSIFVVIPAFNEQEVIGNVVSNILSFNYQIIIVDDGSAIPVYTILKNLPVTILRHPINLGQGAAIQTGLEYAISKNAEFIITFDADGQHQASDIEKLLLPLIQNEADITIGSRFLKGAWHNMSWKRKTLIQLVRWFNFLLTGIMMTDAHNGLRALNKKAATTIKINENGMAHATEILAQIKKSKLRWKEIPVTVHYTAYSQKKGQTIWSGFRIFFDLLLNKILK